MTQMNKEIDWNDDIRSIVQFRFHKLYILFSSKMTHINDLHSSNENNAKLDVFLPET